MVTLVLKTYFPVVQDRLPKILVKIKEHRSILGVLYCYQSTVYFEKNLSRFTNGCKSDKSYFEIVRKQINYRERKIIDIERKSNRQMIK